jgi:hypothetical protein
VPRDVFADGRAVQLAARSSGRAREALGAFEHVVRQRHGSLHTRSITNHDTIVAGAAHPTLIGALAGFS